MKNVTKLFLITVGAAILSLPVLRAEAPTPAGAPPEHREKNRERMKDMGEHMVKELGLTADQQTKMKVLAEEQRVAAETVRADATLSKEQKKEKMQQLRQDFQTKRHTLMTPEQQKKAQEMKGKFQERRQKHGDKPAAGN